MDYRISYEDFFDIPEGTEITHVICTTMSLDVTEQLKIIACAHKMKEVRLEKALYPILRGDKECFYFFHDKDKTDMACKEALLQNNATIMMLLQSMRYPVKKSGGVFHPKMILMRYRIDEEVHYRLQVSSRNLTNSNSFEVGIQLESGEIESDESKNHNIDALIDFLKQGTNGFGGIDISEEIKQRKFFIQKTCERDILVTVSGISGGTQEKELLALWKKEKEAEQYMHILSPDYETSQEEINRHRVYAPVNASQEKIGTHAKLYFLPAKNDREKGVLWIGSCNSSEAAMCGTNIECMVRIGGIEEEIGFDSSTDKLNVFGTECVRIYEAIPHSEDKYSLISLLNRFIEQSSFSGTDIKKVSRVVSAKVSPKLKCQEAWKKISQQKQLSLEILPLGTKEEKVGGETKWIALSLTGQSDFECRFQCGRNEKPNGVLRVRLSNKAKNSSAEQLVSIDESLRQSVLSGEVATSYENFVNGNWLNRLMDCEYEYEIRDEQRIFQLNLEVVKKIRGLTELQKVYLEDLEEIYNSVLKGEVI